jgi:hypothetical protein
VELGLPGITFAEPLFEGFAIELLGITHGTPVLQRFDG